MELIQFSAPWCAPCKRAREFISDKYNSEEINYKWIDVDNLDNEDPKYASLLNEIKVRSVPTFVVINGLEILNIQRGFSPAFLEEYVEMMKEESNKE